MLLYRVVAGVALAAYAPVRAAAIDRGRPPSRATSAAGSGCRPSPISRRNLDSRRVRRRDRGRAQPPRRAPAAAAGVPVRRLRDDRGRSGARRAHARAGCLGLRLPLRPRRGGRARARSGAAGPRPPDRDGDLAALSRTGSSGAGFPVALVNGRISERSFRRYRLVARVRAAGRCRRIALFAMQSAEDARRRGRARGAPADRVRVTGNLKYDLPAAAPFADAPRLRAAAAGRPMLVAGSTAEGEDALVLDAWSALPARGPCCCWRRAGPSASTTSRGCASRAALRVLRRSGSAPGAAAPPDARTSTSSTRSASSPPSYRRSRARVRRRKPRRRAAARTPSKRGPRASTVIAGPHMENFREVAAAGQAARASSSACPMTARLSAALAAALADPEGTRRRGERGVRLRRREPRRRRPDGLRGPGPHSGRRRRRSRLVILSPLSARSMERPRALRARLVRLRAPRVACTAAALHLRRQPDLRRHRQDALRRISRAPAALRGLAARDPLPGLWTPVPRRRGGRGRRRPDRLRRTRAATSRWRSRASIPGIVVVVGERRADAARRAADLGADLLTPRRRLPAPRRAPRREPAPPRRARPLRRRKARRRPAACASPSTPCARADAVVFTRVDRGAPARRRPRGASRASRRRLPSSTRASAPRDFATSTAPRSTPTALAARRLLAVCGVANPAEFAATLSELGLVARGAPRVPRPPALRRAVARPHPRRRRAQRSEPRSSRPRRTPSSSQDALPCRSSRSDSRVEVEEPGFFALSRRRASRRARPSARRS